MRDRDALYIDGAWTSPLGTGVIAVENPATEETLATVPEGTAEDVDRAVRAARDAFPAWAATSWQERSEFLRRLHAALASREEAIARTIASEVGTPMRIATRIQAGLPQAVVAGYAEMIADGLPDERVGNSLVVREPAGVVAAITPWNYPLHQITCKLAPALAAGCTIVIKPSEVAPLVAYELMDAVHEAGLPAGVVNLVPGYGPVVGEALATHPEVDLVSFTGSVRAGSRVAELAAGSVKKVAPSAG